MTRRDQINARLSQLEQMRRPMEQEIARIQDEQTALHQELASTPADALDADPVARKNDYLRKLGLL